MQNNGVTLTKSDSRRHLSANACCPNYGHSADTGKRPTMPAKLTDTLVKALPIPATGNRITYDQDVTGFGVRVTAGGARSYILNYRNRTGRERRITIGQYPDWRTASARQEAKALKQAIDRGGDPLAEAEDDRDAKTMADLAERFRDEHLGKKRPSTAKNYGLLLDKFILPALRRHKVAEVTYSDVDGLHRKITKGGAPYQANRSMAVLSKMFALAIKWRWRTDNPAKGIERNPEEKRHRYLTPAEVARLGEALAGIEDQQAANIIRLLLLTGARSGEVMGAKWADLDLEAGVWVKPGSTTKQKTLHRVPLSAPARQLLVDIKAGAGEGQYVFPGRGSDHRVEIRPAWRAACKAAGIVDARIHDLRHTYASLLASSGKSLPIIGALLGHSQPSTTARYSHLLDDPLREATEGVGALVMAKGKGADVLPMGRAK